MKLVQRSRDRDHARRAQAILALWETGENVSETARHCHASRNSVKLWKPFFCVREIGVEPRWENNIEKLWKKLHDTVTRNHRHTTMPTLMRAVTCFMNASQPFPGHHSALIRHQR